jgi:transposase
MRTGILVDVSAADRARLEAVVANRNSAQKHVWRARIVLLTAEGLGTVEIMRRTSKSKTAVWRWQERFMAAGVDGLVRDKTRPSRIPPLGAEVAERVVEQTLGPPPGETTHWTATRNHDARLQAPRHHDAVRRARRARRHGDRCMQRHRH